uniref:ABC transporter domain-containing protein n=1 Tax=Urocitellus parryii TaxID=9999 RepID=A0A8D2I9L9_UROPR
MNTTAFAPLMKGRIIGVPNEKDMDDIIFQNFPHAVGITFSDTFSYKLKFFQGYAVTTNHSVIDELMSVTAINMKTLPFISKDIFQSEMFILYCLLYFSPFIYFVSHNVTKERKKSKELMKMMGLHDSAFWLSWGLMYTAFILVLSIVITIIITSTQVILMTGFMVIFTLLFLYGLSLLALSFLMSVLLQKAVLTNLFVFLLTLFWGFVGFTAFYKQLPPSIQWILSICSPFAFRVGMTQILHLDYNLNGVVFPDPSEKSYTMLATFSVLAFDGLIYLMLALYLDKILPYGNEHRYSPLFFLSSSSCFRHRRTDNMVIEKDLDPEHPSDGYFEPIASEFQGKEAIRIRNVKKEYKTKSGQVKALKGVLFDIYEGQITAILGHSGAGKSSLLNILNGLSVPTEGSVTIYNKNLSEMQDLEEIRKITGVCPQNNVQIDMLTVKENLSLFAKIKGIRPQEVEQEVDRKVIMSNGELKCAGSSVFLKRKWGLGYHLSLYKNEISDPEQITSFINHHISDAKLKLENKEKLVFTLPLESTSKFPGNLHFEQTDKIRDSESPSEMDPACSSLPEVHKSVSDMSLWRMQVCAIARLRFLKLKRGRKTLLTLLLVFGIALFPLIMERIANSLINESANWEFKTELYFLSSGQLPQEPRTSLLIINNTESNIEDFIQSLKHQNILLEVDDFENRNGTEGLSYNGAIIVSGKQKDYRFSIVCNTKRLHCFPILMNIISNGLLWMLNYTQYIRIERSPFNLNHLYYWTGLPDGAPFMFFIVCCLSPYIAMSSVTDHKKKASSQLWISGLYPSAYWCGQALVDVNLFNLILLLMYLIICITNKMGISVVVSLGYSASLIFLTYVVSFIFRKRRKNSGLWSFCFYVVSAHTLLYIHTRDIFISELSEHLEVYATVKGLQKEDAAIVISRLVNAFNLYEQLNVPVQKLASGTTKKLCFVLSILGNSPILLLDEPSTGIDPTGQCIGSIQHLKRKFGKDYILELKVKEPSQVPLVHTEILNLFPQAAQQESSFFPPVKHNFNLEEYSLSQCTLEKVFLELFSRPELGNVDEEVDTTMRWKLLSYSDEP